MRQGTCTYCLLKFTPPPFLLCFRLTLKLPTLVWTRKGRALYATTHSSGTVLSKSWLGWLTHWTTNHCCGLWSAFEGDHREGCFPGTPQPLFVSCDSCYVACRIWQQRDQMDLVLRMHDSFLLAFYGLGATVWCVDTGCLLVNLSTVFKGERVQLLETDTCLSDYLAYIFDFWFYVYVTYVCLSHECVPTSFSWGPMFCNQIGLCALTDFGPWLHSPLKLFL